MYCQQQDAWLRRKKQFSVIRFPKCQFAPDDYYYSMLLLLLPRRLEYQLMVPFTSSKSAFYGETTLL